MMNASDLEEVTELIQKLETANNAIAEFDAIPPEATELTLRTHWPNPDPEAPSFRSTLGWGFSLPMGDIKTNQTMQLVREILQNRRAEIAEKLIQLGVDPNG